MFAGITLFITSKWRPIVATRMANFTFLTEETI